MTLEQFAKLAGVTLGQCDKSWGGTVSYQCADMPNSSFCGFKTEKAALNHWLEGTFGKQTSKAVRKLLTK